MGPGCSSGRSCSSVDAGGRSTSSVGAGAGSVWSAGAASVAGASSGDASAAVTVASAFATASGSASTTAASSASAGATSGAGVGSSPSSISRESLGHRWSPRLLSNVRRPDPLLRPKTRFTDPNRPHDTPGCSSVGRGDARSTRAPAIWRQAERIYREFGRGRGTRSNFVNFPVCVAPSPTFPLHGRVARCRRRGPCLPRRRNLRLRPPRLYPRRRHRPRRRHPALHAPRHFPSLPLNLRRT